MFLAILLMDGDRNIRLVQRISGSCARRLPQTLQPTYHLCSEADPNSSTSAMLTTERPRALRCPGIPETTPFTSAKLTTDPSHPLRWTKQAQTSWLHCRKRRADSAPGYPTSAKLTKERPRVLRCPGIPETTPFTSAKLTTDPSHPLRWTKQTQISRLHCRERKADPTPGYPTKRVGASVLLSHFRNRPTGFQAF